MDTKYVKKTYENELIVDYYNQITKKFGIFQSEKVLIEKHSTRDQKILDIGCGTGRTTIGLKKLGYIDLVGIDISERMIKKAKENDSMLDFIAADVLDLPFVDKSFDIAFFSFNGLMLIPNITNRKKALIEIKRVLNKDGLFIFSTPYLDNKLGSEFWKERIGECEIDDYGEKLGDLFVDDMGVNNIYIHIPLMAEVEKMLDDTGFRIVEVTPRLEICVEKEEVEEDLDDNLYWVVRRD